MTWQTIIKPACPVTLWLLLLAGCQGDQSQPLDPTQAESDQGPDLASRSAGVREWGSVASVYYITYDASGCMETEVRVVGSEGRAKHGPGAPTRLASASVSVILHDWCTGLEPTVAQGSTSDGVVYRFNGSKATLRATIPVQGSPGKAIGVDMAWAAEGTAYSYSTGFRTRSRGRARSDVSTTRTYFATASGTVSLGSVALAAGETQAAYLERLRTTSSPDTELVAPVMGSGQMTAARQGPAQRYQGTFATAEFRSLDESGCVESFPTIEGGVERQRGKDLNDWGFVGIILFQIDHCAGTSGLQFAVWLGGEGFQVNRQHKAARGRATIETTDFDGNDVRVDIDVGWTAGGFVRHGAYFERWKDPACRFTELGKGSTYDATARGTVALNGQDVSPEPALAAYISYQTDLQRGGGCWPD